MSKLSVRDDAELVYDVRGLVNSFDDNSYQEKIRDAVGWAEIYVDPQKAEAYGGREAVRGRLFQDLGTAADLAGTLQGNPP
ncbi:MAG TPA: hypothetical protein VLR92_09770 [Blastocatellia bacterium]|nr:hypothetical protein [Blastocatellia bacterium]